MSNSYEEKIAATRPQLQEVIYEFRELTPRERLEMLLDFALELPDLPDRLAANRDQMEHVHECQTPVFLHTELEDGQVHFFLDIPQEAPTIRGYAGALVEGLDGATPEEVLATPEDTYMLFGLQDAITPQRLRGLYALVVYMKRQVRKLTGAPAE